MKKNSFLLHVLLLLCFALSQNARAQYNVYGVQQQKNAFTFNLGQYLVNEINLGYEHSVSEKQGIELHGGFIYRNNVLLAKAKDWTKSQYFYEHGFAGSIAFKIYKKLGDNSARKSYIAPGLNYQYLYFPNEWFDTGHDSTTTVNKVESKVTEQIYQHRFRHRIGLQLTLGNIFPMGKTFGLEIYYGIGVRGILSNRYDNSVSETSFGSTKVYVSGNRDETYYLRPTIHAGVKLRIGW